MESAHKIDSFKYNLNLGDSLVTAHNYKQGIIVFKSLTNSENRVLIQERIKKRFPKNAYMNLIQPKGLLPVEIMPMRRISCEI